MKNTIGIFEAKTHLAQLVDKAIQGEEIVITRRGEAVAKIVPINNSINTETVKAAVLRLEKLSKEIEPLKLDELKHYKNEGRA